jgi:nucleotidyltransferase DUF2204
VSLLGEVVCVLEKARIPHALIGAAALALHAVSRSTADIDLLTVDARTLDADLWAELGGRSDSMRVLRGDAEDPLEGSVRLMHAGEIVDIVVGRYAWQQEIIDAAVRTSLGDVALPVVGPPGLILLKLLAGGAKDAWDIRALLEVVASPELVRTDVETVLPRLPADARRLWERLGRDQ